jgi:hypothetical protein
LGSFLIFLNLKAEKFKGKRPILIRKFYNENTIQNSSRMKKVPPPWKN